MKLKIAALFILLTMLAGCASFQLQSEQTGSCDPYVKYRGYSGPYCSPSP